MSTQALPIITGLAVAAVALGACGGAGPPSASPSASPSAPAGSTASNGALPTTPKALANRLAATDAALRDAIGGWRSDGRSVRGGPPRAVSVDALYVQRTVRLLARRRRLGVATIQRLPPPLAYEIRDLTAARRDLGRLSAGWPAHRVRTTRPAPLGELVRYYRAGQRRFGVGWQVLAAVNFVESAFGRVRNESVAGARGPMQFMPATWRAYGLGGNIRDPHDAILGAANLLRHAGAPDSYGRALYSYNPSPLYVDAVRRYARVIGRDHDAVYFLYSWRP